MIEGAFYGKTKNLQVYSSGKNAFLSITVISIQHWLKVMRKLFKRRYKFIVGGVIFHAVCSIVLSQVDFMIKP